MKYLIGSFCNKLFVAEESTKRMVASLDIGVIFFFKDIEEREQAEVLNFLRAFAIENKPKN